MNHGRKISVLGLGYVGLPVAVAFGKKHEVIGYDLNVERIQELTRAHDRTGEVSSSELRETRIQFTSNPKDLAQANFHIVAVPTPVTDAKVPDFSAMMGASEILGPQLKSGDIVVYESTVYPGATEEHCVPVLERTSGLKCPQDFTVGYSPERINPGDTQHRFTQIKKVVSGQTPETLEVVAQVYESVVEAGVHRASSIRVAEAAKVIENIQRDVNIALMNELSLIFKRLDIDTLEVLEAARTKWNFLPFTPGLVGGHCIGVDPYYLTHLAAKVGYTPQVILSGRRINDSMGEFVASQTVKEMIRLGSSIKGAVVTVLGLTFKENVPDLRNTRVIDIIRGLQEFEIEVQVVDPQVNAAEAMHEYQIKMASLENIKPASAVILAVPHRQFLTDSWNTCLKLLKERRGLVVDVKGCLDRKNTPPDVTLWRL